jgi:hypothetical protein
MGLESQVWIACVLPWLDRTYRAFGAKESKLCFAHAVHARCEPAVTSSDDSGVVVMVSRPSAVPNGPGELTCALRVFCLGLAAPTGHWGSRSDQVWIACGLPWLDRTDGALGVKE